MGKNVAIAGVTGAVGQEFLAILDQRDFPIDSLKVLASSRSAGKTIEFRGRKYTVEELTDSSFDGVDIALFSAGGARSKQFAPAAVRAGAVVVDNSSAFRMDPDVPLVVPEEPLITGALGASILAGEYSAKTEPQELAVRKEQRRLEVVTFFDKNAK